jgi:hypothetical protein
MSQETGENPQNVVKLSLKALNLRPGIALQVRRLVEGASKTEAQLYGAIEKRGVMVGPQGPEGEETGLREGEICIVRGFTGQHEFSFNSPSSARYCRPMYSPSCTPCWPIPTPSMRARYASPCAPA